MDIKRLSASLRLAAYFALDGYPCLDIVAAESLGNIAARG
jgi:hypothetical protein